MPVRERSAWTGLAIAAGAIVLTVLLILAVPELRHAAGFAFRGDTDGLRREIDDLGATGVAVIVALILLHAVVFYPAEIPTAAAGYILGFTAALPLVLAAWMVSALLSYALGARAARPVLHALAGRRRFERAQALVLRGGVTVLLTARLIPVVPFSLIGYVAGAAGVPLKRFAWTTLVGMLPLMTIVTLLGSRLEELSLSDPSLWLLIAPIVVLGIVAHPVGRRLGGDR